MIRHPFISVVKHLLAQQTTTFGNKDGILGALANRSCLKLQTVLINWNTELEPTAQKICKKNRVFVRNFSNEELSLLFQGY